MLMNHTALFIHLNWIDIYNKILYRRIFAAYKCLNGLHLSYIVDLFTKVADVQGVQKLLAYSILKYIMKYKTSKCTVTFLYNLH